MYGLRKEYDVEKIILSTDLGVINLGSGGSFTERTKETKDIPSRLIEVKGATQEDIENLFSKGTTIQAIYKASTTTELRGFCNYIFPKEENKEVKELKIAEIPSAAKEPKRERDGATEK